MESPTQAITIWGPLPWSQEAENGLDRTWNGSRDRMYAGVVSGEMQLYRLEMTPGISSWLIVQVIPGCLWMWCYQGEQITEMTRRFLAVAHGMGIPEMGFFTMHRTVLRFLRKFNPVASSTDLPGETCWRMKTGVYPK